MSKGSEESKGGRTPGYEVHGFILHSVDVLDDYQGFGYHYHHRITGMEVYHISNSDSENFFSFIFRTPVQDDCGTPHIIEHSVLAGSADYPVKDPFMSLLKGSAQTFMNAMTYPDFTAYPAASVVEQDFTNLFRVYADAVFNPLLKEETFWQEGIRIIQDDEGKPRYEGVVFNEMLGEMSDHDALVSRGSVRHLFPDTTYVYESGGDPLSIVDLTYQKFKAYYSTYYHPSNCRLFLYGNADIDAYLEHLNSRYLLDYSSQKADGPTQKPNPWKKERELTITSPMIDTQEDGKSASVTINWATKPVDDPVEVITLSLLTDILLGNPGAPLYEAVIESALAKDISQVSGMETSFSVMPFTVGFRGIDPADAAKAKDVVYRTLQNLVRDGIDATLVDNAIKRQEFALQEITGSAPMGLRAMNRCLRGWLNGSIPSNSLRITDALEKVKNLVSEARVEKEHLFARKEDPAGRGYFEQWIEENLLDNTHVLTLTVQGDESYSEDLAQKIDAKLGRHLEREGILASIERDTRRFRAYEEAEDTPENLKKIPTLKREDVNQPIRTFDQIQVNEHGADLLLQTMHTNGIIYFDGMIDVSDLSEEELMILPLLTRLLHMCGIGETPYTEVAKQVRTLTGGFHFFIETGSHLDDPANGTVALAFRIKCLSREFRGTLTLLRDLLIEGRVDDMKRIHAVLNDLKSDFESNVSSSAHLFALQRASRHLSPLLEVNEMMNGIVQWDYLRTIDMNDSSRIAALAGLLKSLLAKLAVRNRLTLHLLCDDQEKERCRILSSEFISSLEGGAISDTHASQRFLGRAESRGGEQVELFSLPSSVAYNALVTRSAPASDRKQVYQSILMHILTTGLLWDAVRGSGGAYGVSASIDMMEALATFQTYRDPRISGSYRDYFEALEEVAGHGVSQEVLDSAIIAIVSRELHPMYPQKGAILAFRRHLYRITDEFREERRALIISCSVDDIKEAAATILTSLEKEQYQVVISGEALLKSEENKNYVGERTIKALGL